MSLVMDNYRLGLDVGTNSIGWCVLTLNAKGEPCKVKAAGVRIFNDGRDHQSKATLKATRRENRSARRRRDRFKQRQLFLLEEMTKSGLFPKEDKKRKELQKLNPLELRARAIREKLNPYYIGRALFHLNQRRGFKSNRKDRNDESTRGKVSDSVWALLEQMQLVDTRISRDAYKDLPKEKKKAVREEEATQRKNALDKLATDKTLTFGSFLRNLQKEGKPTRARPHSDEKLYEVYPTRELLEDEFQKIWDAQASHYPDLMTDSVRERIRQVVFSQRELKPQVVGKCSYLSDEERTFRAMPSFQRYRIYQEVNNLEWTTSTRTQFLIEYPEARDAVIDMLERPATKKGDISFKKMKKVLKEHEIVEGDIRFNFETEKRRGFDGNLTSHVMQGEDYVGPRWHDWSLEKQDEFIGIILDERISDDEVSERLRVHYGLSEFSARKCTDARLLEGTANLSIRAARLIYEKMHDERINQTEAVQILADEIAEFNSPLTQHRGKVLSRLPYYGEAFQGGQHIIPGTNREEDRHDDLKYFGGVTNPTVHIALNQIRLVVNELIDIYGHPASVSIELGRELPLGPEGRGEIVKEQTKNQKNNERLNKILLQYNQIPNRENRLRLRLWEDLNDDPCGRCCPFSGNPISITDLFNGEAQIEHLIPFSSSLDDSNSNKVVCTRQANQDKGQNTPFQAFGHSPNNYNWHEIYERAKCLPESKQWRFRKDALEIWWKQGNGDFTERHLNDTRYIARMTKDYLKHICSFNKIDVVTGRLTSLLRRHWELNNVLNQSRGKIAERRKNRDDHCHHAVDAIVIGMTTRSMLQKVSTAANKAEHKAEQLDLNRLFEKSVKGKSPIAPWEGFEKDVEDVVRNIIVSHKVRRKKLKHGSTDGQLHEDTAYGVVSVSSEGLYKVVTRKPIEYFNEERRIKNIRDNNLRHEFLGAFNKGGGEAVWNLKLSSEDKEFTKVFKEGAKKAVAELANRKGIRTLRYTKNLKSNVIPIRNKSNQIYKVFYGKSNWGIEIYEYPLGHEKSNRWEGIVISRYDANKSDFRPGQTKKPHPAARLVMRLQINDCVEVEENGVKRVMRLQKISQNGSLDFAEHYEANVDSRNSDKEDPFKYLNKTANRLKSMNVRKIHISPAGRVSYEKRHKSHWKS